MTSWVRAAVLMATVAAVFGASGLAGADVNLPPNATTLSVDAGGTTAHINAKLTPGSAIAGQVTDEAANPLQSAQVTVLTPSGRTVGYTYTDFSGNYRVASLPPTSTGYAVCVSGAPASSSARPVDDGYISLCNGSEKVWWPGRKPTSDARLIATQLSTTQTANMILSDAGAISGTITSRSSGKKLVGAYAYAYTSSGFTPGSTYANDGTYKISGLAPGRYRVCFQPPYPTSSHATGYVSQCSHNVRWLDNGTPAKHAAAVNVDPDVATEVDQSLPAAGAISGTVRTAGKHPHPTADASIEAYAHGKSVGYASPDDHGVYRLYDLSPGTYKVCAYTLQRELVAEASAAQSGPSLGSARSMARAVARSSGAAAQCWKDTAWSGRGKLPKAARAVHVHGHKTASGVDFKLSAPHAPATISGHITSRSGAGVGQAVVLAFRSDGAYAGAVQAGKHGKYRLGVAGSSKTGYVVCAAGPRELLEKSFAAKHQYGAECWKDEPWSGGALPKNAARVKVARGHTHKGINIALPQAGRIAGQVSFEGQPAADVEVIAFDLHGRFIADSYTDDDGQYVLDGISPAKHKYEVCFETEENNVAPSVSPDYGFRPQCYRNQPWDGKTN